MKILTLLVGASLLSFCTTPEKKSEVAETPVYIETAEFAALKLPFSEAVKFGNILYLSGQIGTVEGTNTLIEGGIVPETNQTMKNIKSVLEQNGSSMDNIIKCTCMLADIGEWAQMSAEYVKYFPNHKPARSAFAATGLALNARVEIECIAYVGN